jgi:aminoglycoside phosphotransferase (APT) family kinase protein
MPSHDQVQTPSAPAQGSILRDWALGRLAQTPERGADPASSTEVGTALLSYLARQLKVSGLRYTEEPAEFPDGWETYTYSFKLASIATLPELFDGPLVVRIYSSPHGLPRVRHEFAVLQHLRRLHFPVPEPVSLEEDCAFFGGPFVVMTRVSGVTLLARLLQRPWTLWNAPKMMAELQARLHCLPTGRFPNAGGDFQTRLLRQLDQMVTEYDLQGLTAGLHWLSRMSPTTSYIPRIVHLDFHPINIVCAEDHRLALVDWPEADVGDLHADIATTVMLVECVPAGCSKLRHRLAVAAGRPFLIRRYLRAYKRRIAIDAGRLAYYRACAAFRRLCSYGRWLRAGPQITGSKPSSLGHLSSDHIKVLQSYFEHWTGVKTRLLSDIS